MNMANIDLTPIIQAIIVLLATIVTSKVIPWIKAKTTNEQQVALRAAYKVFVFAAEQMYGAGHGAEKMEYVKQQCELHGYTFSVPEIEATVREYFPHNYQAGE